MTVRDENQCETALTGGRNDWRQTVKSENGPSRRHSQFNRRHPGTQLGVYIHYTILHTYCMIYYTRYGKHYSKGVIVTVLTLSLIHI